MANKHPIKTPLYYRLTFLRDRWLCLSWPLDKIRDALWNEDMNYE